MCSPRRPRWMDGPRAARSLVATPSRGMASDHGGRGRAAQRSPKELDPDALRDLRRGSRGHETEEIVLTREYRHGLGRVTFSLPGGTAKDGESAEACARRELLEETGYQAPRLLEMYTGNNLTAYLEGTLHLFFGRDCQATERRPDPDEIQAVERMSVTEALSRARAGEFESAVVTLGILMADARGWLVG